jgi:hypothetical protein
MQEEELEEHMVVEESATSVWPEEQVEHHAVVYSFKTLREEWPRA